MGGACGAYGGGERCAQGSGGETGGKETIGGPRSRWNDNIKTDFRIGIWGMDWMQLAQDRYRLRAVGNEVMNLRVL